MVVAEAVMVAMSVAVIVAMSVAMSVVVVIVIVTVVAVCVGGAHASIPLAGSAMCSNILASRLLMWASAAE